MSFAQGQTIAPAGWLKDRPFDLTLILGVTGLACAMGLSVAAVPALFLPLLTVHTWCFGFDHVIATFTRLAGLPEDRKRHRALIYALPLSMFALVLLAARLVGVAGLNTTYFFAQWFHTTRQSWGIAQHYRRVQGGIPASPVWLSELTLWSVPVWGILRRCEQQPKTFLYMDIALPVVPSALVTAAAVCSTLLVLLFIVQHWQRRTAHTLYMCTHLLVYALAYVVVDDLHAGWLLVNVWHNVQYLAYVWMRNRERFASGVRENAKLLSWLCQPGAGRAVLYFLGCLAISSPLFAALYGVGDRVDLPLYGTQVISLTLLFAFTVNFHHYIVDAIIWRRRSRPA